MHAECFMGWLLNHSVTVKPEKISSPSQLQLPHWATWARCDFWAHSWNKNENSQPKHAQENTSTADEAPRPSPDEVTRSRLFFFFLEQDHLWGDEQIEKLVGLHSQNAPAISEHLEAAQLCDKVSPFSLSGLFCYRQTCLAHDLYIDHVRLQWNWF